MKPKENLTNEKIKDEYVNQFDMVINAIEIAREIIHERIVSGNVETGNSAVEALSKLSGKELP